MIDSRKHVRASSLGRALRVFHDLERLNVVETVIIRHTTPNKMSTPIQQALVTLVPTLNTLPQELIDLSTSLLAQSRNKASSLKAEEEIGRTYACAHIAVERLKHRLDIDKIVARPPVAPRIYKKLYGYLDAALSVPATPRTNRLKDVGVVGTPGSGRGRRSALGTPVGTSSKTPVKSVKSAGVTPSKTPISAAKSAGSVTASGRRSTRSAAKEVEDEVVIADSEEERQKKTQEKEAEDNLPEQVRPMAEAICDALDVPQAASHVCTAISAVLQLRGWNDTKLEDRKPAPRSSAKKEEANIYRCRGHCASRRFKHNHTRLFTCTHQRDFPSDDLHSSEQRHRWHDLRYCSLFSHPSTRTPMRRPHKMSIPSSTPAKQKAGYNFPGSSPSKLLPPPRPFQKHKHQRRTKLLPKPRFTEKRNMLRDQYVKM